MHAWGNQRLPSDVDTTSVEDDASEVDEHPFAGEYQVAVVAVEGRFHEHVGCRIGKQLTGDIRHRGFVVFGNVESPEQFFHFPPPRPHLRRMGIVWLPVLHPSQFILK